MIRSTFSTPAMQVREFADEAMAWLEEQSFAGTKKRSHPGRWETLVIKFWNQVPKHDDPTQLVMNYRGWFVVSPTDVMLTVERVPAHHVDPTAAPDTAAIINTTTTIPFAGLDSLAPLKAEIKRYI